MALRWRADDDPTLNAGWVALRTRPCGFSEDFFMFPYRSLCKTCDPGAMIFQGARTSISKESYSFVGFPGRGGTGYSGSALV